MRSEEPEIPALCYFLHNIQLLLDDYTKVLGKKIEKSVFCTIII